MVRLTYYKSCAMSAQSATLRLRETFRLVLRHPRSGQSFAESAVEELLMSTPKSTKPDAERTDSNPEDKVRQTGEGITDMRKANENIRKAQDEDGEDVGRPVIDRHR